MIVIYRFFYQLIKVLLLALNPVLDDKTKKWVGLRLASSSESFRKLQFKNSIWVHASSGEIEYAKTLIRKLKQARPQQNLVVTYSSESAEKLFDNIRPFVDAFIPLPWDDPYSLNQLIKIINPAVLIFSRTDLWPELVHQCARRKMPLVLISYYPKIGILNRLFLKSLLRHFQLISCVDENVKHQLQLLGLPEKVQLSADGDTRFDQVFARLEQVSRVTLHAKEKIFVFGSTWPEDEVMLSDLFAEIIKHGQHVVLSPHDVSVANIDRLEKELTQKNYAFKKNSQMSDTIEMNFPVLLVDRIGFLADLYRAADFAFVGGSFKARVHSVMEPLGCGLPVFIGPHYKNSPEAVKYADQIYKDFVLVNTQSKDLVENYLRLNTSDLKALKQKITSEIQKNQGASEKIADFILNTVLEKADS